jgi:hypothetical protein
VAARTKMVVTVECLLLPVSWVNKETLPRLHSGNIGLFIARHRGVFRFLTSP